MIFVLGLLILFAGIMFSVAWHELGHYATARWFGIKVPEFMVGFGKTLWSRRVGETEFGLKAIPLGGYIRMIGMLPPAKGEEYGRSRRTGPFQGLIDDARAQSAMDVLPQDAHRQFYLRAPWKRIVVMAAGPFMNLVLATALFAISIMAVGTVTGTTTTVGSVSECFVEQSEATADLDECPVGAPPTPAAEAGFLPGDTIVAFNGRPFGPDQWDELSSTIQSARGVVTVTVERDGELRELTSDVVVRETESPEGEPVRQAFLGVQMVPLYERQGPEAVVALMGEVIGGTAYAIVNLPERLPGLFGSAFLGAERDPEGPVGIVGVSRVGGEFLSQERPLQQDVSFMLTMLALVNVSLFLFNMLPFPPLDGGQIFPAVWEAAKKRIARVRGKPDPGPVDSARLLPVALVVALFFIAWSVVLLVADIVNPVRLF